MERFVFAAELIHWRGPAPFYFAKIPDDVSRQIAANAKALSYGWGVIPVEATIDDVTFRTSLFPKDGGYLLPLKVAVRKQLDIPDNGQLDVTMALGQEAKA